MTKQDTPSQKADSEPKTLDKRIPYILEAIGAIVSLLAGLLANLATVNISEINYLTVGLVFGGFLLLLIIAIVIMRKIYAPPSKVKSLSERISTIYLEALDDSILNPSNIQGGQNV
jgi:hypothetical protein